MHSDRRPGEDVLPDEYQKKLTELAQENAQLKQRLADIEKLVMRDTLTPLYNRRYFMEALESWQQRADRHGSSFGLIYIDVDDLKSVNDNHGHNAGDELLIAVAAALNENIRRFDVAARIGGDEFALLLDNIGESQMQKKMGELQAKVHAITLRFGVAEMQPRISLGFAMLDPAKDGARLLAMADADMYAQKQAARQAL